jgi:hypothetical protein
MRGALCELGAEDLDRDLAFEIRLIREEDVAHATLANAFTHHVLPSSTSPG